MQSPWPDGCIDCGGSCLGTLIIFAGLANAVFSWQDSKLFAILKTDDWFGGKTRLREELRRQLS